MPDTASAEPQLVHFRLPYGAVPLEAGSAALTRAYDEMALVAALQGIVNRDAPRLYLLGVSGHGVEDVDAFWWARMAEMGWPVAQRRPAVAEGLGDLLAWFGHRARGLAVWDPRVPATLNVAATLAGVLDLLPVAFRPDEPGSLYAELVAAGWHAEVSLVAPDGEVLFTGAGRVPGTDLASTGSAKNDAYLWAKVRYLDTGRCSADHLAYYIDAWWLRCPAAGDAFWNNTLVNHDYYVAHRAFFFDLDPWTDEAPVDDPGQAPGTDGATLRALLAAANARTGGTRMIHAGGFPPWAFKYTTHGSAGGRHAPVPTEWHFAEVLSAYNAYMEADALGMSGIANASFTQHFPLRDRYPQAPPPDRAALAARGLLAPDGSVPPGRYFAFYVGDYDAPAWLYQMMPTLWLDENRGSVPLSWAFNPNLSLRAGPAMAWTRETATPNDVFIAGDSGAGYVNPGALETPRLSGLPSGVSVWTEHCRRFYRQWDISVTGFIIDGDAPAMGPEALAAYREVSPGGIVGQKVPRLGLDGDMPVMAMNMDIGGDPSGAAAAVRSIFLPLHEPQFGVARAIIQRPTWFKKVADALEAGAEGAPPIRVLDLPTLLALARAWVRARDRAVAPAVAPPELAVSGQTLAPAGLRPLGVADSRWHLEEVDGRPAVVVDAGPRGGVSGYLYLGIAPAHRAILGAGDCWLEVGYHPGADGGRLLCEYNGPGGGVRAAYRPTPPVEVGPDGGWRQARLRLAAPRFRGAQNGGADLRLTVTPGMAVDHVRLVADRPGPA